MKNPFKPCWTLAPVALVAVSAAQAAAQALSPFASVEPPEPPPQQAVQVERGRPRPVIDGVGRVLSIPAKVVFWDRRVDSHEVSPQTEEKAVEFLEAHDVDEVMVRVNQYDPLGEWRRLRENDELGAGWRYTVGSVYTLGYTLFPGRVFGGDWYNPFTNSMHLYSDIPALAMEQAAYAKDVRQRETPGVYASTNALPIVGLLQDTRTKDEVYRYVDANGDLSERKEARRVLEPRLGAQIGGDIGSVAPGRGLWALGGAVFGHFTGGIRASVIEPSEPAKPTE